ncbi:MAG: FGGY family carbohydrate kinase [Candidatus Avelusimicrobium sp.]|uniref:FGGY family carbohydrate kinase n=1 Tax=Candidatus Avelusimicrobium sp. TaxID=3048833 RepID=UPI003EFDA381
MTEKMIVSLDLGTSGCRAAVVSVDGLVKAQKSIVLVPVRRGAGLSEYDAEALFSAQQEVLNAVLDEAGPQNVLALALSSQRSTVVLWDKLSGKAVAPVLTWEDGRAAKEAEACILAQPEIHALTGLYKTPYFSAPKIAWCVKHCPQAAASLQSGNLFAAPVLSYVIWRLTGGTVFACDPTLAQRTLLFDINQRSWSGKLCRAFGVPVEALPSVLPSAADYGIYDYKGFKIPIRACAGDQQAAAYAMGVTAGTCAINYGTGAFLLYNAGAEQKRLAGVLSSLSVSSEEGAEDILLEGPVNAAGSLFLWLNAQGFSFEHSQIDALCQTAKNPVWLLPALGGLGAPYWDFSVSPVAGGLSALTKKDDWVAGAVRGVAFSVADVAYYLKQAGFNPVKTSVSGGLSRVGALVQFQADILQKELTVLDESESSVLGAARLAAQKLGFGERWKEVSARHTVSPKIFAAKADKEYQNWREFMVWAKNNPL